jgi:hypothetical protein
VQKRFEGVSEVDRIEAGFARQAEARKNRRVEQKYAEVGNEVYWDTRKDVERIRKELEELKRARRKGRKIGVQEEKDTIEDAHFYLGLYSHLLLEMLRGDLVRCE